MTLSLFCAHPSSNKGSGLVEVLIAVLVIAIGATATLQMFVTSSKNSKNSYYRLQTQFYIDDLLSRMRGNLSGVHFGHYAFPAALCSTGMTLPVPGGNGDGQRVAKEDLRAWTSSLNQKFSNASCRVVQDGANPKRYRVTLGWTEDGTTPNLTNCNQNGATLCFSVTSLVCANFEVGNVVNSCP
jgi:type IV pilus modification protein PilV